MPGMRQALCASAQACKWTDAIFLHPCGDTGASAFKMLDLAILHDEASACTLKLLGLKDL